jgi:hypothetical protein
MKTLKINVPDGYEIDKEQSTFENIVFKEIEKGLPKSWEEIENLHGFFVNYGSDVRETDVDVMKTEANRNIFATKEQGEASVALAQLSQLREVYRQGWKPDYTMQMQKKWVIRFYQGALEIEDYCSTDHFLSFQSKEIADQFLGNFRDLIEKAKPLMS